LAVRYTVQKLAQIQIWGSKVKGQGRHGQKTKSAEFFSGSVLGVRVVSSASSTPVEKSADAV